MESVRKRKRNGDLRSLRRISLKWLIAAQLDLLQKKVVGRDSEIPPTVAPKEGLTAESGAAEVLITVATALNRMRYDRRLVFTHRIRAFVWCETVYRTSSAYNGSPEQRY